MNVEMQIFHRSISPHLAKKSVEITDYVFAKSGLEQILFFYIQII